MGTLLSIFLTCAFLVIFVGSVALFWLVKSAFGYDNRQALITTGAVLGFAIITSFVAGPLIISHLQAQAKDYVTENVVAPVTEEAREAVAGVIAGAGDRVNEVLESADGALDSAGETLEAGTDRLRNSLPSLRREGSGDE